MFHFLYIGIVSPIYLVNHWLTKATMSAFNAKKNVGMASLQHSDTGDNSNRYEITRQEMVDFLKRELQCSLGSVPMPITMAILVDQYRWLIFIESCLRLNLPIEFVSPFLCCNYLTVYRILPYSRTFLNQIWLNE